jgi:hypothetical protein
LCFQVVQWLAPMICVRLAMLICSGEEAIETITAHCDVAARANLASVHR